MCNFLLLLKVILLLYISGWRTLTEGSTYIVCMQQLATESLTMALQRPVRVSLPYVNDYTRFSLCVGDKVKIPTDVWEYAATTINKVEQKCVWLSDDLPPTITGVVRWLGTLPIVGDKQLFAGIQTVSIFIPVCCKISRLYITNRPRLCKLALFIVQILCSKLFNHVVPHPF